MTVDQQTIDETTRAMLRNRQPMTAYDELALLARQEAAQHGQTFEQAFDAVMRREPTLRAKYAAEARPEPEPDGAQRIARMYHEALAAELRSADETMSEAQAHVAALDRMSPELRALIAGKV